MNSLNATLNSLDNTTQSSFDATRNLLHSLLMVENNPNKDFADRLKVAMKEAKLKTKDIQAIAEVTYEMARRYVNGVALPRSEKMEALAARLGVDVGWLQFGTGSKDAIFPREPDDDEYALIPQYSALGECGTGNMNEHVEVRGQISFKKDWLARMGLNPKYLTAIYADGDSMYPTITDEAVVLLDHSQADAPKEGKVYAIQRHGNGLVLKRLFRTSQGWIYRSDNSNKAMHPDLEPLPDDKIIGRVVWQGGNGGL